MEVTFQRSGSKSPGWGEGFWWKDKRVPAFRELSILPEPACSLRRVWLQGSTFPDQGGEERIAQFTVQELTFQPWLGGLTGAVVHSCALTLQGKACAMWGSWRNLLDLCVLG